MSAGKIRVAVIGCGKRSTGKEGWAIGHSHAQGWLGAGADVELFAVDVARENLAAFAERFAVPAENLFLSTSALYEAVKPDFVSVCTWPGLHAPMTIEAAAHGAKGVVCEKPMALDLGEMRAIRDKCRDSSTRLAIAHQRRYESMFQTAREIIRSGVLGENLVLEGRVGDEWDILSWTVHWFDMANFFFDAKPVSVMAGADFTGQRRYQQAVENRSTIYVEYDRGQQASFITGPAHSGGLWIRGTRGLLEVSKQLRLWTQDGYSEPAFDRNDPGGFVGLMKNMLEAGSDGNILCGIENTFAATELAYAAHESIRTRRKVSLPLQTQFAPLEVLAHARERSPVGRCVLLADEHYPDRALRLSPRDGLIQALQSLKPASLDVVDAAARGLNEADLAAADVLLIFHTRRESQPDERRAIGRWVESGRPMVIVHCGIGAYADWPEFRQWIGYYWVWNDEAKQVKSKHPHVPCEIEVVDEDWKLPWRRAWLPKDEVYMDLGKAAEVRMLATTAVEGQVVPVAWQSRSQPHITAWIPGHRPDIWELDITREGLSALIQLATESAKRRF